jgi:hypothetical protein
MLITKGKSADFEVRARTEVYAGLIGYEDLNEAQKTC